MAFANAIDVSIRLGRVITDSEEVQITALLNAVGASIALAVGKDEADIADNNVLRYVSVEAVLRSFLNPEGLVTESESLGSYQYRKERSADRESGGVMLTESEALLVRRAVYGTMTGSSRLRSHVDDVYEALLGS